MYYNTPNWKTSLVSITNIPSYPISNCLLKNAWLLLDIACRLDLLHSIHGFQSRLLLFKVITFVPYDLAFFALLHLATESQKHIIICWLCYLLLSFYPDMGNEKSNSYWEAELPPNYDRVGIENFIRAKYVVLFSINCLQNNLILQYHF